MPGKRRPSKKRETSRGAPSPSSGKPRYLGPLPPDHPLVGSGGFFSMPSGRSEPSPAEESAVAEPEELWVALLRGINVGGHKRVPMADLRELAAGLGWSDVETYIQSGNLLFRAPGEPAELESALEAAVERRFGIAVPVIVRAWFDWSLYSLCNPWFDVSQREPKLVHLAFAKRSLAPGAVEALRARAADGERIEGGGDALWIHYPKGAGRSKLTPALFDRLAGSPVTARNWNTYLELFERLRRRASGTG